MEDKKINMKFSLMAIFAIIMICVAIAPIALQNDTFYTVKIGEHIVQNGNVDMQDPFSWHENLKYTYPHWLYDVIMYLIFNNFGWNGIYISTVILSCLLGLVLYATNVKLSKNCITSFILTIGVMYLGRAYIAARAQLPTFILFVLTIYCLEMFMKNRKLRYAGGLVLISLLIANLHVAVWPFVFILFMPYIGEYLIAVIADCNIILRAEILLDKILLRIVRAKTKEKVEKVIDIDTEKLRVMKQKRNTLKENPYKIIVERNPNAKWLIIILIVCVLTGLCTPLGDTPYTYLSNTMKGNTTQNINEHLPLTLVNQKDILCLIVFIIAMLTFTDIKIRLKDLFLIAGLIYLTLMSRRQISLLLIIGVFVFNTLICYFTEKYAKKDMEKFLKFATSLIGKIVILAIIALISYKLFIPKMKLNEKYINEGTYPVSACDYILDNLDLENMKIYNEYNYGSYMLYRGIPVFVDSRADLYSPEFNENEDAFSDFLNISNIGTYYEDKFKEYKITHVILYKNAKLNMFLSRNSEYKELYSDNNFVIYERLVNN